MEHDTQRATQHSISTPVRVVGEGVLAETQLEPLLLELLQHGVPHGVRVRAQLIVLQTVLERQPADSARMSTQASEGGMRG